MVFSYRNVNVKAVILIVGTLFSLCPHFVHSVENVKQLKEIAEHASGHQKAQSLAELTRYYRDNAPIEAKQYALRALALLSSEVNDPEMQVKVMNDAAWIFMTLGDYAVATSYAEKSLESARRMNLEHEVFVAWYIKGFIAWRQSNLVDALKYYEQALNLAERLNHESGVASVLNSKAIIFDLTGKKELALAYFLKSMEIHRSLNDQRRVATALNNVAAIYGSLGIYDIALKYQMESLQIRNELGDKPGIAEITGNLGVTYSRIKDYATAQQYFKDAADLYQELNDLLGLSEVYLNLGKLHQSKNNYEQALEQFNLSLALSEQLGDQVLIAKNKMEIASVLLDTRRLENALQSAKKGISIAESVGVSAIVSRGYIVLSKIAYSSGHIREAENAINHAIDVASHAKEQELLKEAYYQLAEILNADNRYDLALAAYKKYQTIKDQIFSNESDLRLALMRSYLEVEKSKKEIQLLKSEQQLAQSEIDRQLTNKKVWVIGISLFFLNVLLVINRIHQRKINKNLQKSNDSQKELIQAIAHEFRTPLSRVRLGLDMLMDGNNINPSNQSLVSRIDSSLDELDGLLKEAIGYIRMETDADALNVSCVQLPSLVHELITQYQDDYPNLLFQFKLLTEKSDVLVDKIKFQRALSNGLRNACQYAKTRVLVEFCDRGSWHQIVIEDDGDGIPAEERERVFQPFVRVDKSRTRASGGLGLGLALLKGIVELHGGQVALSTSRFSGTKLEIRWPKVISR